MRLFVNVNRLPVDVLRATQGKVQESGADRIVGQAVNHDETAGIAIFLVGIKCDWLIKAQVADADFIQVQCLGGEVLERIDVDLVFRCRAGGRHGLGADLQQIGAARQHRLIAHPDDRRLELVCHPGRCIDRRENVAPADIDLVLERNRDRLARDGFLKVTLARHDTRDPAFLPRRQDTEAIAALDAAADNDPGIAAEVEVRSVDPLHRHAKRPGLIRSILDLHRLKVSHQCRPLVPRGVRARLGDIVALQG
ncbi:hypothetical protein D3C71_1483690 [compost metagenome]